MQYWDLNREEIKILKDNTLSDLLFFSRERRVTKIQKDIKRILIEKDIKYLIFPVMQSESEKTIILFKVYDVTKNQWLNEQLFTLEFPGQMITESLKLESSTNEVEPSF